MAPSRGESEASSYDSTVASATISSVKPSTSTQSPPPESPSFAKSRAYIVLSFWIVIVSLGLPLWWKTTTIVRSSLPIHHMTAWSEGRMCHPEYPIRLLLDAPSLAQGQAASLLDRAQKELDETLVSTSHKFRIVSEQQAASPSDHDLTIILSPSTDQEHATSYIKTHTSTLYMNYDNGRLTSPDDLQSMASTITQEVIRVFDEEQQFLTSTHIKSLQPISHAEKPELLERLDRRRTRSAKYAPKYHLTFSMLTQSDSPRRWEIEQALQEYLFPLLNILSPLSTFDVDTQIQAYSRLSQSVRPTYMESSKSWVLSREDLGSFINAAEWPLTPSIGSAPTINFILYVPDHDHTPLVINASTEDVTSNSWLVPQWGGIAILNRQADRSGEVTDSVSTSELEVPMLQFTSQTLALLGLPSQPAKSLPLQIKSLRRSLIWSLISSTSATLGALARLTESLPSIAVPASVANSVDSAIAHLSSSCSAMKAGNYEQAFNEARAAEAEAEQAFFEPSMVGQVYFPDEHKVAVYLPLLGPIAVPLVLGGLSELKGLRNLRRWPS